MLRILALVALLSNSGLAKGSGIEFPIIASPTTGIERLSYQSLYSLFVLRVVRWPNGLPVRLVTRPFNTIEHIGFLSHYFGIGYPAYVRRVSIAVESGRASPPLIVDTDLKMLDTVRKTPGAIGYLSNYAVINDGNGVILVKVGPQR
jgi:hypothetical protein